MFWLHADSFPLWECVGNFINCFSWAGVIHVLNGVLPNFWQNPQMSVYFQTLVNLIRRVVYCNSNRLGFLASCESLDGFLEIGTHSEACGGCHVSSFSGRSVTVLLVSKLQFSK